MSAHDRRDFLRIVAAGAVGTAVPSLIGRADAAPMPAGGDPSRWRPLLLARRSQVHTLQLTLVSRLIYTDPLRASRSNSLWVLEGSSNMLYDSGRYRFVYHRGDFVFTEISSEGRFLQKVDRPGAASSEVLYDGPLAAQRRPKNSLEKLMPVPEDRPVYGLGTALINSDPCEILGQGDVQLFISQQMETVVRLDRFADVAELGESIEYLDHREILRNVLFPSRILATRFGSEGKRNTVLQIEIGNVVVNRPIPPNAFDFAG